MSDYDSKIIRKQIRVYGSVQGVGFRYRTEHAAESVGATGWVRNDPDGSVFMEIQGTEEQIDSICNAESGYLCKYRENGCQINTGG